MKRKTARRLKILGVFVMLLALFVTIAVLTLRSPWFHEQVRQRIVAELERVTGGTAMLGGWVFNWELLTVEFNDLTLHGSEPANVPPLVRARSIKVGLKIISFWKRNVDIQSLEIVEPQVNLIVAADGSTNVPAPKIMRRTGKIGLEPLLDWKIGAFAFENGTLLFAGNKHDINARGEKLQAKFSYDFSGPRYKGQLTMQPLRMNFRGISPLDTDVYLVLSLEKNRIEFSNAKFDMRGSHLEATGAIEDLSSPKAVFQFTARVAVDQAGPLFRIRAAKRGTIELAGSFNYDSASDYTIASSVRARDLDVQHDGIRVSGVRATSKLRLNRRGMKLDALVVDILGGRFTGEADFPEFRRFVVNGTAKNIPIQEALSAFAPQLPPAGKKTWSGVASGPVRVEGELRGGPVVASANVSIAPAPGGIPVEGAVDGRYDGRTRMLSLGKSYVVTPAGRLDVTGVLGEQVQVQAVSTNLDELLPVINAFSKSPINSLPIQLRNGKATFTGTVSGKLNSPEIAGAATAASFTYSGIDFDSFAGRVKLNESSLSLQDGKLARRGARAQISGSVGMTDWKILPSSPVTAAGTLSGGEISELLTLARQKQIPVRGGLTVAARISGTVESPRGTADINASAGVAYDEPFDRLQASVEYSPQLIAVRQVRLTAGPAQITASASFEPTRPAAGVVQFRDGRLQFQIATNDMAVQRFQFLRRRRPDIMGVVRTSFQGTATLQDRGAGRLPETLLTSLNGDLTTQGLRLDSRAIGNIKATAKTEAAVLKVQVDSNFLNSNLVATGQWRLAPGYPGEASARFSEVSLGMVREWLARPGERTALNFDGSAEGAILIAGPALDPRGWKAAAQFSKVQMYPQEQGTVAATPRFTLRNEGPVLLTMEKSVVTVAGAHFTGPLTDVRVSGTALIEPKPSLDLRVNGDVNLAVARNFTRDIETDGAAKINASVRGPLDQPLINGRLDVSNGSLHFTDITTGLSGATGAILFSGKQANIQDFSGQVGGGKVELSGVVGYAGRELSYHVDVEATDVRVRYPEGASTSADAELNLRGTSQRSTLSGSISVLRTGFNPRTDFASILGKASEPVRTPSARVGPLSGMHFDVRIETAPDISFESSFAQDIQVEGSLRLQGTPYNPVLLGRLSITQGEINFFGTRYTISQGSVTFANPVKMEPVLNVDLETRVQGIDVILTVSGPINKLNVTPRSDPPLEMSQVLALLATGSARSSDPTLVARQTVANQGFTQLGASALIGQVVANPVSSRLQRFFGVSRLKIDPQLSGVENNPQARLTLEQQVAKNLTFTYITNLSSSNQQIVRVEWSLNRNWSVIAVRDENGLFGVDFLYKKSFK